MALPANFLSAPDFNRDAERIIEAAEAGAAMKEKEALALMKGEQAMVREAEKFNKKRRWR